MKILRPLILASRSPQRRRLLKGLGVPFRILPAEVSETLREKNPRRLVERLAVRKALWVARRQAEVGRKAWVLGADTIVVCRDRILLKPRDTAESLRMLRLLNGRWHRVYTGVALADSLSGRLWRSVEATRVKARRLDPDRMSRLAGRHLDKSGGYAMQDARDPFIERVVGRVDNVIGLPMNTVRRLLRAAQNQTPEPNMRRNGPRPDRSARGGWAATAL